MFKYMIYDSPCNMLTESDYEYESEDEAIQEAKEELELRIDEWKSENTWHGETVEDFEVRTKEDNL